LRAFVHCITEDPPVVEGEPPEREQLVDRLPRRVGGVGAGRQVGGLGHPPATLVRRAAAPDHQRAQPSVAEREHDDVDGDAQDRVVAGGRVGAEISRPGDDEHGRAVESLGRGTAGTMEVGKGGTMAFILWIIAVILVVAGIVTLIRGGLIAGIVLIIVGLLVGPGGYSIFH
jgi:hypothetical protein